MLLQGGAWSTDRRQADQLLNGTNVVRGKHKGPFGFYGFKLVEPDLPWRKLVGVLKSGMTHEDLDNASRFLPD